MGQDLVTCPPDRVATRANAIQIRRFASQTKPMQDCHPERSEGSLSGGRSFAALRMTKRDGLLLEMYCTQGRKWMGSLVGAERLCYHEDNYSGLFFSRLLPPAVSTR